jgi:hypothetical protein
MFDVDKYSDNQKGDKNPVGDRNRPGKLEPGGKKQKRGNEFYNEVSERDWGSTIGATPAQKEPTQKRHIMVPFKLLLAYWTKRTPRFVYREIKGHPIDANIQE